MALILNVFGKQLIIIPTPNCFTGTNESNKKLFFIVKLKFKVTKKTNLKSTRQTVLFRVTTKIFSDLCKNFSTRENKRMVRNKQNEYRKDEKSEYKRGIKGES